MGRSDEELMTNRAPCRAGPGTGPPRRRPFVAHR